MGKARESRKRRRIRNVVLAWLLILLGIFAILAGAVFAVRAVGRNRLKNAAVSKLPNLQLQETEEEEIPPQETEEGEIWQEGWVRSEGKIYEYNTDIMTFLVMGIDKLDEVDGNPDGVSGGQSDALILAIMDTSQKKVRFLTVNRDTMVDVKIYGVYSDGYDQTVTAQIATQHGFGDGREQSCELTRDAVSALLYDLPIAGYISVNMGAIPQLNDALGGIEVVIPDDMTKFRDTWKQGTQITLKGEDAFYYVEWRDVTAFESNRVRLERQKQYLTLFLYKALEAAKKDITLPITLYKKLSSYMVTDVSIDEMTYLVSELLNYSFETDEIYSLTGTTEMGDGHEEFYPDYGELRKLMIRLFYREVDPQDR